MLALACAVMLWLSATGPPRDPAPVVSDGLVSRLEQIRAWTDQDAYERAVPGARTLLAEVERDHGEGSLEAAMVLDVLADAVQKSGRAQDEPAREMLERALEIKRRELGDGHLEVARTLQLLGDLDIELGDYEAAERALQEALEIKRAGGARDASIADAIHLLGWVSWRTGRMDEARERYDRSIALYRQALGPEDALLGRAIGNLAILHWSSGEYPEARTRFEEALAIFEVQPVQPNRDVGWALNNLAIVTELQGNFAEARSLYERSLQARMAVLGPDHPHTGSTLGNLAILHHKLRDYDEAQRLYEQAIAIYSRARGAEHPETVRIMNNLAILLNETGRDEQARPLLERILAAREQALGPEHYDLADTLDALAAVVRRLGDAEEAVRLRRRSLALREAQLGSDHPLVAVSLDGLATLLSEDLENHDGAKDALERALAIRERRQGRIHPDYANTLYSLALTWWASNETERALAGAREAERIFTEHARDTLAVLPERQALRMVSTRTRPQELIFSGMLRHGRDHPAWVEAAWESVLMRRGLVLEELASRHRTALTGESDDAREAWEALAEARIELAELAVRGPAADDLDAYHEKLVAARRLKERRERRLADLSARFRAERGSRGPGVEDVAAALPDSAAIVEFARIDVLPAGSRVGHDVRDVALTLRSDGSRGFVDLGPSEEIDALVDAWREALVVSSRALSLAAAGDDVLAPVRRAGGRLRERVWDPVAAGLEGARLVFLVPDGALHRVDWAALPADRGRFLVETGPTVHLLSTGRDLVRLSAAGTDVSGRGMLALGSPDFDAAPGPRLARGETDATEIVFRGAVCPSLAEQVWAPLPESGREVRRVGRLFGNRGESAVVLTGARASEERLKREAPGRLVLHLATHGFFLGTQCAGGSEGRGAGAGGTGSDPANPLLSSGLVLAGANRAGRKPSENEGEDGVVTAEELAALDLGGMDLAVLSGCDTGRGETAIGEGVLGLRRALEIAGVRTVVMSLWPVPDRETRRWMTRFYEQRLAGVPIGEAVRGAHLSSLSALREREQPPHPYLWSGFVAAGDWR